MMAAGHVADIREAFDRWLGRDRPAFVPRTGASPEEVIHILHRAGALVSLAHPGRTRIDGRIPALRDAGLDALEVYHADHDEGLVARYAAMASDLGLLRTGGSDFHGDPARTVSNPVAPPSPRASGNGCWRRGIGMPSADPVVRLAGVVKDYRGLRPLRVARLELHAGESCALLGFDQVTAEVLVDLITGATVPDSGLVEVFGQPTSAIADADAWLVSLDRFGLLSERAVLVEQFTAEQNLILPLSLNLERVADELRARVRRITEEVGLPGATSNSRLAGCRRSTGPACGSAVRWRSTRRCCWPSTRAPRCRRTIHRSSRLTCLGSSGGADSPPCSSLPTPVRGGRGGAGPHPAAGDRPPRAHIRLATLVFLTHGIRTDLARRLSASGPPLEWNLMALRPGSFW
jgi:hypothetical protein